nr:glutathione synthetase-like [Leptinotarsa decemlineata]
MCSVSVTPACVPLPLPDQQLKDLVRKTRDWAILHGASMRSRRNFSEDSIQFAPFNLFPSTFLKKDFQKVVDVQATFQELIHKVAHDGEFLRKCLKDTIQVDEFTGNLFKIYETVQKEGIVQPLNLGLFRCDYMLESGNAKNQPYHENYPCCCWKQVEYNTIASGFGWLGPISAAIQRYVVLELFYENYLISLPENNALDGLCEGMLEAWKAYGNPEAIILFIIENVSYNIADQRFHEFRLRELRPDIKVVRKTLTEISDRGRISATKTLTIDEDEVAVVYFRAGYEPNHYPSKAEWDARLLIERSKAIKCPTIQYHLAGTKKVQQELSKPGAVEYFLKDTNKVNAVRELFVGLYGLDFDESGDQAIEMALRNPERYVLKPQREGGGNNIYGTDIKDAILNMKDKMERTAWILMERIFPPITRGYLIRPGGSNLPPISEMVSEMGIFGVIFGDSENILVNRQVGHMLRTKTSTANEGGVAAGDGALDSPYLLDC